MEALAPRPRIDVSIWFAAMDRREPVWRGREGIADVVVAHCDGRNCGELRSAAVVECVGVDGEQRTDPVERADRHRSGHDRGNIAVEHGKTGGCRMPLGARQQPGLEFVEWR